MHRVQWLPLLALVLLLRVGGWAAQRSVRAAAVLAAAAVAGSAGGRLKTGAHINLSETTGPVAKVNGKYVNPKQGLPLANLWLTQMQAFGLKQDRFADSSGVLKSMLA